MTDAERGEVGNDRRGLRESKVAIELQTIRRERDVRAYIHDCRNHATDQGGSVPRFRALSVTSSLA